ncbi:NIPSNAP family protein [Undibacterium griseum]|uniref:NIPSNAP family protein n=1 Tax=Undibacterium griseum TaxID=2762295 RepID=A0ABR6YIY7_9BURK|nr:NIPSNAP family protein [Undibacterium griseum]MBC3883875.1 NIPSNAP family protein [Undibacterium griseum]
MNQLLEIRNYQLLPASTARFHQLMEEAALPLLQAAGMEVVFYGPSLQQDDAYCLIRAYRDVGHLQRSQAQFYESEAWRNGPRNAIVALIVSYQNVAIARQSFQN